MIKTLTLTLAAFATAFAHDNGDYTNQGSDFGGNYEGKATFYGAGGSGEAGACMLARGFNDVGLTVAINGPMWNNAQNCGKCIKLVGTGFGIGTTPVFGPIYATIDNVCPECKYGDIDLGLEGDGRWVMKWDFVDCAEARASASILPIKGPPQNHNVRALRAGEQEAPVAGLYLAPGKYMTPEGIKDMAEVKAAAQTEVVSVAVQP